ncbi:MAG: hypothetical protein ISP42_01575 [Alphaproteobacteria bacterium]|nr:hypothetical protein [Alphaproteobacteria bacterium]
MVNRAAAGLQAGSAACLAETGRTRNGRQHSWDGQLSFDNQGQSCLGIRQNQLCRRAAARGWDLKQALHATRHRSEDGQTI